jgi:hypothetical protein
MLPVAICPGVWLRSILAGNSLAGFALLGVRGVALIQVLTHAV